MKFAKRPRDPAQLMIDIASGEVEDRAPDIIDPDKDPAEPTTLGPASSTLLQRVAIAI